MNYRFMFTINAVALGLFGAGLLIMPDFVMDQFNIEKYVAINFLSRFFGATLLLLAWFLWMLKDMASAKVQRVMAIVFLAYSVAGFAATIMGMSRQSIGVIRTNGWVMLVVYGFFTLIYGYVLFLQPKEQKQRAPKKTTKTQSPTPPTGIQ
ncbi:MAG: hypothetical protein IT310_14480 [Anaerolineales bacterium]|nr:hypothetical protein [Anaerolineales bacterium]